MSIKSKPFTHLFINNKPTHLTVEQRDFHLITTGLTQPQTDSDSTKSSPITFTLDPGEVAIAEDFNISSLPRKYLMNFSSDTNNWSLELFSHFDGSEILFSRYALLGSRLNVKSTFPISDMTVSHKLTNNSSQTVDVFIQILD